MVPTERVSMQASVKIQGISHGTKRLGREPLVPSLRRSQVDKRAWQETHALKISCQAPMMDNENLRQVVIFNGVVGTVESSGNCEPDRCAMLTMAILEMVHLIDPSCFASSWP